MFNEVVERLDGVVAARRTSIGGESGFQFRP